MEDNLFVHMTNKSIQIPAKQLQTVQVSQIGPYISKIFGFSTRVHLYRSPLHPFSKLDYLQPTMTIEQARQAFPNICFTYNNTLYIEETESREDHTNFKLSNSKSNNSVIAIIQICQENNFVHERYSLSLDMPISYVKSICRSLGTDEHFMYYELRIPLSNFGNDELLKDTFGKMIDRFGKLVFTISSMIDPMLVKMVQQEHLVDWKRFIGFKIDNICPFFVVNREAEWSIIVCMLPFIFNCQLQIKNDHGDFIDLNSQLKVNSKNSLFYLRKKPTKIFPLSHQLQYTLLLHSTPSRIYLLQKSSILHIFSSNSPYKQINRVMLHSPPTQNNDQDMGFVYGNRLILYSITVSLLKLRYYTLQGKFLYCKRMPWNQGQLWQFEFSVFDLICVRLKPYGSSMRVFQVVNPQAYVQIDRIHPKSVFYPARRANNTFSDGSGLFAIHTPETNETRLFSLIKKECFARIIHDLPIDITNIIFCPSRDSLDTEFAIISTEAVKIYTCTLMAGRLVQLKSLTRSASHSHECHYYDFQGNIICFLSRCFRRITTESYTRIPAGAIMVFENKEVMAKDDFINVKKINSFYQV